MERRNEGTYEQIAQRLMGTIVAGILFAATAHASNWVLVGRSVKDEPIYIDTETIKFSGTFVRFWEKWETKTGYKKLHIEQDRTEKRFRILSGVEEKNGQLDSRDEPQPWSDIPPDSIQDGFYKYLWDSSPNDELPGIPADDGHEWSLLTTLDGEKWSVDTVSILSHSERYRSAWFRDDNSELVSQSQIEFDGLSKRLRHLALIGYDHQGIIWMRSAAQHRLESNPITSRQPPMNSTEETK
jgi:hypothetical protein